MVAELFVKVVLRTSCSESTSISSEQAGSPTSPRNRDRKLGERPRLIVSARERERFREPDGQASASRPLQIGSEHQGERSLEHHRVRSGDHHGGEIAFELARQGQSAA